MDAVSSHGSKYLRYLHEHITASQRQPFNVQTYIISERRVFFSILRVENLVELKKPKQRSEASFIRLVRAPVKVGLTK